MTQPPLAIVRAWQEKSAEASIRCKDHLTSAIYKGFNAIAAVLDKDSTAEDVQCALAYLSSERSLALQFDKSKDDSLRDLVYGLLESMHVSLNEWNEERNQRKEIGEISTQTEPNNPSLIIPIEPKEEPVDILQSLSQDYEISASELMRDEKMIMKEEMEYSDPISPDSLDDISTAPDFTRTLLPFNPREEPRYEAATGNNQMQSLLFPPPSIIPPQEAVSIDFVHPSENMSTMGNFTPSNPKMKKEELMETQEVHNHNEIESMEENQNDDVMQPSDFMGNRMNFDDELSGDGDLPLAENIPPSEVSMSTNDMDGDGQQLQNDLIDNEGEEEEGGEAMGEAADTPKDNSETANVEKRKRSSRHVPRPMQYAESLDDSDDNGGPLVKKSRSDSTKKADNKRKSIKGEEKSVSVSKKPIVSKENATDLKCPECEFSTRIVMTWITHLKIKHSTTPDLAGLALLCECGHASLSHRHSLKCNRGNVTVIKGEEKSKSLCKKLKVSKENDTDLECPECEFSTRIMTTWMTHLRSKHSTTPSLAGLALLCECGHESLSHIHSLKCNHGNTTVIRKRDGPIGRLDDEKTTPQCVLCEAYPRTTRGYAQHLQTHHKSSLVQNGIYLMCSCGIEVYSDNSRRHLEECDPRQFTLHKLDDE